GRLSGVRQRSAAGSGSILQSAALHGYRSPCTFLASTATGLTRHISASHRSPPESVLPLKRAPLLKHDPAESWFMVTKPEGAIPTKVTSRQLTLGECVGTLGS